MKKYILLICFFIPMGLLSQSVYYISPKGNDKTGNGSSGNPWFSVGYAANHCTAGGTVICKTGTYSYNTQQTINVSGFSGKYITIISEAVHPDSVIFDFWNYDVSGEAPKSIYGIYSFGHSYLMFKGLTVKRLWKINTNNGRAHGFYIQNANHILFNFCVVDSIAGRGFQCHNSADIFYYNCDAIWCADPQLSDPGNAGTGFLNTGVVNESMEDTVLYQGCRGWYCADQGFASDVGQYATYDSCWAFANGLHMYGYTFGTGIGFKPGFTYFDVDTLAIYLKYSISAFNPFGLNENSSTTGYKYNMKVHNSTFFKNDVYGIISTKYSINLDNVNEYRNNISFDNGTYDMYIQDEAVHSHNSFDEPYQIPASELYYISPSSVNNSDFVKLPTDKNNCVAILGANRKSDGSLPDIGDYFQLSGTSDLIDAGIAVGLPFNGNAPDLGAFELKRQASGNFYPTILITSPKNGSEFKSSKPIPITVDVADMDGSVSLVEFYENGKKIEDISSTTKISAGLNTFLWNNVNIGPHSITAVAIDKAEAKATTAPLKIMVLPYTPDEEGGKEDSLSLKTTILYPNPNDGNFTLFFLEPLHENTTISIISEQGKPVYAGILHADEIEKKFSLTYIEPGTYTLVITGAVIILTISFVKV